MTSAAEALPWATALVAKQTFPICLSTKNILKLTISEESVKTLRSKNAIRSALTVSLMQTYPEMATNHPSYS